MVMMVVAMRVHSESNVQMPTVQLDVPMVARRGAHAVAAVVGVRVVGVRVDDRGGVPHDVGAGGGGCDVDDFD